MEKPGNETDQWGAEDEASRPGALTPRARPSPCALCLPYAPSSPRFCRPLRLTCQSCTLRWSLCPIRQHSYNRRFFLRLPPSREVSCRLSIRHNNYATCCKRLSLSGVVCALAI